MMNFESLSLRIRIAFLIAMLSIPGRLVAQTSGALVEVFTNASCQPCAYQNPLFQEFLRNDEERPIVVVEYHTDFPGRDTMYSTGTTMDSARSAYYGSFGVPIAFTNGQLPGDASPGWYPGAPGDTAGVARAINTPSARVDLRIRDSIDGDSIRVHLVAIAREDIGEARLRIVAVERTHYYPFPTAGTNGEETFHDVARAMLPSIQGVAVSVRNGDTATVDAAIAMDPEWTTDRMYTVAFLQIDSSRVTSEAVSTRARAAVQAARPDDRDGHRRAVGEPLVSRWYSDADVDPGRYVVHIGFDAPPGWTNSVTIDGAAHVDGDTIVLGTDGLDSVVEDIRADTTTSGRATLRVQLRGMRGAVASRTVRLYSGRFDLLAFLRADADTALTSAYHRALAQVAMPHAVVEDADRDLLSPDSLQILMLAASGRGLTADDIQLLRDRAASERLLVVGPEIAWGLGDGTNDADPYPFDTAFMRHYLHVNYIEGNSPTTAVNGPSFDPIGDGIHFNALANGVVWGTPDVVEPIGPARASLYFGSDRTRATAVRFADSTHRVAFMTMGPESMPDSANAPLIFERTVDWLMGSELTLGVGRGQSGRVADATVVPMPASDEATLRFHLSRASDLRIDIVDPLGRTVGRLERPVLLSGDRSVELPIGALPAGLYFVRIQLPETTIVRRLLIVR